MGEKSNFVIILSNEKILFKKMPLKFRLYIEYILQERRCPDKKSNNFIANSNFVSMFDLSCRGDGA
ncbi:MAG TPA: hypothetical protein PLP24_09660 [Acetivibrio thermocellus]|nr:hypothetical protein [Acetivibrio thermocellus]